MTTPLSTTLPLQAVVGALEMQGDETSAYLNRSTGELVILSHEEISAAEAVPTPEELAESPQWQREAIESPGGAIPMVFLSSYTGEGAGRLFHTG